MCPRPGHDLVPTATNMLWLPGQAEGPPRVLVFDAGTTARPSARVPHDALRVPTLTLVETYSGRSVTPLGRLLDVLSVASVMHVAGAAGETQAPTISVSAHLAAAALHEEACEVAAAVRATEEAGTAAALGHPLVLLCPAAAASATASGCPFRAKPPSAGRCEGCALRARTAQVVSNHLRRAVTSFSLVVGADAANELVERALAGELPLARNILERLSRASTHQRGAVFCPERAERLGRVPRLAEADPRVIVHYADAKQAADDAGLAPPPQRTLVVCVDARFPDNLATSGTKRPEDCKRRLQETTGAKRLQQRGRRGANSGFVDAAEEAGKKLLAEAQAAYEVSDWGAGTWPARPTYADPAEDPIEVVRRMRVTDELVTKGEGYALMASVAHLALPFIPGAAVVYDDGQTHEVVKVEWEGDGKGKVNIPTQEEADLCASLFVVLPTSLVKRASGGKPRRSSVLPCVVADDSDATLAVLQRPGEVEAAVAASSTTTTTTAGGAGAATPTMQMLRMVRRHPCVGATKKIAWVPEVQDLSAAARAMAARVRSRVREAAAAAAAAAAAVAAKSGTDSDTTDGEEGSVDATQVADVVRASVALMVAGNQDRVHAVGDVNPSIRFHVSGKKAARAVEHVVRVVCGAKGGAGGMRLLQPFHPEKGLGVVFAAAVLSVVFAFGRVKQLQADKWEWTQAVAQNAARMLRAVAGGADAAKARRAARAQGSRRKGTVAPPSWLVEAEARREASSAARPPPELADVALAYVCYKVQGRRAAAAAAAHAKHTKARAAANRAAKEQEEAAAVAALPEAKRAEVEREAKQAKEAASGSAERRRALAFVRKATRAAVEAARRRTADAEDAAGLADFSEQADYAANASMPAKRKRFLEADEDDDAGVPAAKRLKPTVDLEVPGEMMFAAAQYAHAADARRMPGVRRLVDRAAEAASEGPETAPPTVTPASISWDEAEDVVAGLLRATALRAAFVSRADLAVADRHTLEDPSAVAPEKGAGASAGAGARSLTGFGPPDADGNSCFAWPTKLWDAEWACQAERIAAAFLASPVKGALGSP